VTTPDFVLTPEVQLIDENIVGDEYYSMVKSNVTTGDFEQTILGYRAEVENFNF